MNIAFAGLRHDHIFVLANLVRQHADCTLTGWWEADETARSAAAAVFPERAYESYEALLADETVDAVAIGDYYGIRGQRVIQALKETGSVYFAAIGGCAAYMAACIEQLDVVAYDDLGTESIKRLVVRDLPLTVAVDSEGNDAYAMGIKAYLDA